jgi:hypothetical protein
MKRKEEILGVEMERGKKKYNMEGKKEPLTNKEKKRKVRKR